MSFPLKSLSPEPKYTPVSVSISPVVKVQGNLTGTVRQIRDTVADLYNLTQKWNSSFLNGVTLIQDITDLKLSSFTSSSENSIKNIYPKGLESMCEDINAIFIDLVTTINLMRSLTEHLTGIRKLEEFKPENNKPLFLTWPTKKFEIEAKIILEAYENELKIKRFVKEHVSHSTSKDSLLSFLPLWVQQCYVDSDINFRLEAMLKECGHR